MISSQADQSNNIATSSYSFKNIEIQFQSFHGRMVNLLNPLGENWISDLLTKIATLFASVIVYPVWGAIKVVECSVRAVQACFINTEDVIKTNETKKDDTSEIKEQIFWDLQLWSESIDVQNFKGDHLKIYFGANAENSEISDVELAPTLINKNSEEFKDFINYSLTYIQDCIDNGDGQSPVDIEFLIIGDLETKYNFPSIEYQSFRQSYVGTKCTKRTYIHPDTNSMDSIDNFMKILDTFKLFTIVDEIWNEDGTLIPL
ncbi:MAG: hypothetical protein H0T62_00185 [Parachlamydiaceae bacterium]|nr:hypothetical protein [Parachlamydiaceae bacterium]